jgi:DNA-binding transcriptional regulator YiaG
MSSGQNKPNFKPFKPGKLKEVRRKLGLNQGNFWKGVGITQSGGSRYESGQNVPKPVCALIRVVYGDQARL